jgi:hypothetical protein
MQCLLQVFDSSGQPRLNAGSRFRDHVAWLPLLTWSFGESSASTGSVSDARLREIQATVPFDDPSLPTLQKAASGDLSTDDWSRLVIDCFKDDGSWYMRTTFQNPLLASFQMSNPPAGRPVTQATFQFTSFSIDYRDPDNKVSYFMPSGAVFDPEAQVCRVYDPDDPVSRLQQ